MICAERKIRRRQYCTPNIVMPGFKVNSLVTVIIQEMVERYLLLIIFYYNWLNRRRRYCRRFLIILLFMKGWEQ